MASGDVTWFRYERHGSIEQEVGAHDSTLPAHHGHYSFLKELTVLDVLLAERGKSHGDFGDNALLAQRLKAIFRSSPAWEKMTETMREALDLKALKLSRLLTGDPFFKDHWLDDSGYSQLVVKSLEDGTA